MPTVLLTKMPDPPNFPHSFSLSGRVDSSLKHLIERLPRDQPPCIPSARPPEPRQTISFLKPSLSKQQQKHARIRHFGTHLSSQKGEGLEAGGLLQGLPCLHSDPMSNKQANDKKSLLLVIKRYPKLVLKTKTNCKRTLLILSLKPTPFAVLSVAGDEKSFFSFFRPILILRRRINFLYPNTTYTTKVTLVVV